MAKRSLPAILAAFAVVFIAAIYHSYVHYFPDADGCGRVWMWPSYARLTTFTKDHSRMAEKYSVLWYREGNGVDTTVVPQGIPVLFIPGHAGSYGQARSLASYCSRKTHTNSSLLPRFDFFTADFTEDFTAFHGRTMLDQAEYLNDAIKFILSLYSHENALPGHPVPESVIVIGHSMGGIVARSLVALPNYLPGSINTIITLASPHTIPPLTFDRDIMTVYDLVNQYWRKSFANAIDNPLEGVSLVSITGGKRDGMVPADYCAVSSVVPPSNGFTTYTYSMPRTWTGVDHLAVVWCAQMRDLLAESLFDIADPYSPLKTKSLPQRMTAFADLLLSGFEGYQYGHEKSGPRTPDQYTLEPVPKTDDLKSFAYTYGGINLKGEQIPAHFTYKLNRDKPTLVTVATDVNVLEVRLCKLDKSLNCTFSLDNEAYVLPKSSLQSLFPHDSLGEDYMRYWQYELSGFDAILVSAKPHGFVSISESDDHHRNVSLSPSFFMSKRTVVPAGALTDISLDGATNDIIAYKVVVNEPESVETFSPIVRQYVKEPFEARFHVNVNRKNPAHITFGGSGPFLPFDRESPNNLHLQVFAPPSRSGDYEVLVSVDWWATLGNLALRYRIFAATFPIAVLAIVTLFQVSTYDEEGNFMSVHEALSCLCRPKVLWPLISALAVGNSVLSFDWVRNLVRWLQIPSESANMHALHEFNPRLVQTDMYLGLQDWYAWPLGPVFFLTAIGICTLVWSVAHGIHAARYAIKVAVFGKMSPYASKLQREITRTRTSKRLIIVGVISLAVMFAVPFQLAFLLAALMQCVNTGYAYTATRKSTEQTDLSIRRMRTNAYNFNLSLSLLLLWTAIVDAPILIVWVHNLANVKGAALTPFSSHHNVLSVLPVLLVVENISAGNNMIPRMNKLQHTVTRVFLCVMAYYAIVYGMLHTYMLHHLTNIWCGWLLVLYLDDPGTRQRMPSRLKHRRFVY
ncbi:GPI inositol-deacylase [Trichomonascus vanleenenianus]|uniref:GPI inositol-deacylase n=1 Tax=Trichomonascus vanleenenianus TaxID=2268995 RepID=UPI003EC96A6A